MGAQLLVLDDEASSGNVCDGTPHSAASESRTHAREGGGLEERDRSQQLGRTDKAVEYAVLEVACARATRALIGGAFRAGCRAAYAASGRTASSGSNWLAE